MKSRAYRLLPNWMFFSFLNAYVDCQVPACDSRRKSGSGSKGNQAAILCRCLFLLAENFSFLPLFSPLPLYQLLFVFVGKARRASNSMVSNMSYVAGS